LHFFPAVDAVENASCYLGNEALAVARVRGWVAVIDEVAGHCQEDTEGIPR
jgi:hypothetical protein